MIALNEENGEVKIDNLVFNSGTSPMTLSGLQAKHRVEDSTINSEYPIYILRELAEGRINLMFMFHFDRLICISLEAADRERPFEIMPEDESTIHTMVQMLGGEHSYTWGKVTVVKDERAGDINVTVFYNS